MLSQNQNDLNESLPQQSKSHEVYYYYYFFLFTLFILGIKIQFNAPLEIIKY